MMSWLSPSKRKLSNEQQNDGALLLEEACRSDDPEALRDFLQAHQGLFIQDDLDHALHALARVRTRGRDPTSLMEVLIHHGANVNFRDSSLHNTTPLHAVCELSITDWIHGFKNEGLLLQRVQVLVQQGGAIVNALDDRGKTPLLLTTWHGYETIVQYLLEKGAADPDLHNQSAENRPLWAAVCYNKISIARLLVQHGADVNFFTEREETTLVFLVCSDQMRGTSVEILDILLSNGAQANSLDSSGRTPLHYAVVSGQVSKVKLLLQTHQADPNFENDKETQEKKDSPLHMACSFGTYYEEVVTLLLSHGAHANATNQRGWTPLMYAIHNRAVHIVRVLLQDYHANPNLPTTDTLETSLHKACWMSRGDRPFFLQHGAERDSVTIVNLLLQHGADVNARDSSGRVPLHCAYDQLDVCRVLVQQQYVADVNAVDNAGETPLFYCIGHDALDTARFLLTDAAARLDVVNQDDYQVLHVACALALPAVQLLVEHGANVHATAIRNQRGMTPLQVACKEGPEDVVAFLLAQGADPNQPAAPTMITALHVAACRGRDRVVHLLLQQQQPLGGVALDAVTFPSRQTALHLACAEGEMAVVKLLMDAGADAHVLNATGATAFDLACENRHVDILFYFLREQNWMANLM